MFKDLEPSTLQDLVRWILKRLGTVGFLRGLGWWILKRPGTVDFESDWYFEIVGDEERRRTWDVRR